MLDGKRARGVVKVPVVSIPVEMAGHNADISIELTHNRPHGQLRDVFFRGDALGSLPGGSFRVVVVVVDTSNMIMTCHDDSGAVGKDSIQNTLRSSILKMVFGLEKPDLAVGLWRTVGLVEVVDKRPVGTQALFFVHGDVRHEDCGTVIWSLGKRVNELPVVAFELGLQERAVQSQRVQHDYSPSVVCVFGILDPKVVLSEKFSPPTHMLVGGVSIADIVVAGDVDKQRFFSDVGRGPVPNFRVAVEGGVFEQAFI